MTPPPHFDEPQRDIAVGMLNSAIVAAERNILSEDTARIIIGYLASQVDCFEFIHYLCLCCPAVVHSGSADNSDAVNDLLLSILDFTPREEVEEKIKKLSDEEFNLFLDKLNGGDAKTMHRMHTPLILARVYESKVLSTQTFFALTIESLRKTCLPSGILGVVAGGGGPFGFESLLRSFLGDYAGDEDGDNGNDGKEEPDESEPEDDSENDHADESGCCGGGCGGCCGGCHGGCGGCGHCGTSDNK